MRFIHELSVKTRLKLVLLFFIIFGIVFATFSIYQIRGGTSLIQQMHDHSLNVSNVVLKADLNVEKSRNLIKEIIMSKDSLLMEKDQDIH